MAPAMHLASLVLFLFVNALCTISGAQASSNLVWYGLLKNYELCTLTQISFCLTSTRVQPQHLQLLLFPVMDVHRKVRAHDLKAKIELIWNEQSPKWYKFRSDFKCFRATFTMPDQDVLLYLPPHTIQRFLLRKKRWFWWRHAGESKPFYLVGPSSSSIEESSDQDGVDSANMQRYLRELKPEQRNAAKYNNLPLFQALIQMSGQLDKTFRNNVLLLAARNEAMNVLDFLLEHYSFTKEVIIAALGEAIDARKDNVKDALIEKAADRSEGWYLKAVVENGLMYDGVYVRIPPWLQARLYEESQQ